MKDICVRETYMKDNVEKSSWNKVGVLIESKGKMYIKMFHMPNQLMSIFEPKEKDGSKKVSDPSEIAWQE